MCHIKRSINFLSSFAVALLLVSCAEPPESFDYQKYSDGLEINFQVVSTEPNTPESYTTDSWGNQVLTIPEGTLVTISVSLFHPDFPDIDFEWQPPTLQKPPYLPIDFTIVDPHTVSFVIPETLNGDRVTLGISESNLSSYYWFGLASVPQMREFILNDSGVKTCGDFNSTSPYSTQLNNSINCITRVDIGDEPVPSGQDGDFGRDVDFPDDRDGYGGFSYTKLNSLGVELSITSTDWQCVRDNVTGLVWEAKTNDSGFQDTNWTYSWYNSTGINDGGRPGSSQTKNEGNTCFGGINCNTENYVENFESMVGSLCGYRKWRLPTITELQTLRDFSKNYYDTNSISDERFFPNLGATWSSTSAAPNGTALTNHAWASHYAYGYSIYKIDKSAGVSIMLVAEE